MSDQRSLLDQIHAIRTAAEQNGQHDLAQWLKRHADEGCAVVVAWAMGPDQPAEIACAFCANTRRDAKLMIAGHAAYICDECVRASTKIVTERLAPSNPPAPDASTDAVREARELVERHAVCAGSTLCRLVNATKRPYSAKYRNVCADADNLRPLLAALADTERRHVEERAAARVIIANLRQETYAIRTESNNKLAAAEKRAKEGV